MRRHLDSTYPTLPHKIIKIKSQELGDRKICKLEFSRETTGILFRSTRALLQNSFIIEFFTIAVSVTLSDRSSHREEQKKIRPKLPPMGFETRTSGSSGQCLTNRAKSTFSCQPGSSWPL